MCYKTSNLLDSRSIHSKSDNSAKRLRLREEVGNDAECAIVLLLLLLLLRGVIVDVVSVAIGAGFCTEDEADGDDDVDAGDAEEVAAGEANAPEDPLPCSSLSSDRPWRECTRA